MGERQERLRQGLRELGFDEVRFADAATPPAPGRVAAWLAAGHQADMAWMERTAEKREHPSLVLPGARSIILLGVSAWRAGAPVGPGPAGPIWARYACHSDYHDTIRMGLVAAGRLLESIYGVSETDYRYYADTGPVAERGWAAGAGMGFIGKNAMLISRRHGNWLMLAAILTRIELAPDAPLGAGRTNRAGPGLYCGKCTRCLEACPTDAFPEPGVVDARRCISYQTIENRGLIPRELRAGIGPRVFGCDTCLDVCPWNRFARAGRQVLLEARDEIAALSWRDLLRLTPAGFAAAFRRTVVKRLKWTGLLRNACVGAGNSGDRSLLPELTALAGHESPVVRAHAVWAVRRLAGDSSAARLLADAQGKETDVRVLEEYQAGVDEAGYRV